MSEQVWYYMAEGQQTGPVGLEEMRGLVEQGVVTPQTMVWREGMADWVPARQAPELFTARPVYAPGAVAAGGVGGAGRPTVVTVFGILNIVFGTLGVICSPLSIAVLYMPITEQEIHITPAMRVYAVVGGIVGVFMGLLLIAAGIGLLNLRAWARKVSYGYGWFAVVWGVIGLGLNLVWNLPEMERGPEAVGGMCGGICGGVVGLIYPVLLIIFMRKPQVVEACGK